MRRRDPGPERKRGKPGEQQYYSPWCSMVEVYMERSGLNQLQVAQTLGRTPQYVISWRTGRSRPPLEDLEEIADALLVPQAEREGFYLEAQLAHAPQKVRELVRDLHRQINELRRPGKPAPAKPA